MSMQPAGRTSKVSALSLTLLLVSSGLLVLPLMATPVAAVAPAVMNEWYADTDCNGHVDAVTFRMTQDVHDVSIRPSDFKINYGEFGFKDANGFMTGLPVYTCDPGPSFNVVNTANRPPTDCGGINNECFTLLFPEGLTPDGGPQSNGNPGFTPPGVSFVNDPNAPVYTHDDPVASKMTNLGSCTTTCRIDASPPILMAAYGKVGDTYITVVFSENVAITVAGVNSVPTNTDICVSGGPAGLRVVNSFPANNVPNRVYRIAFTTAGGTPVAITDQTMLNGMQVYVGVDPVDPAPDCSSALGDSNNPAAHNVVPYKRVYVGAPTINRIYANSGDEQLIAEFSGPVWDGSTAIPGNSFTVNAGGGSGITGLNTAITHAGGNDRALLTTTSVPSLADVAVMGTATGGTTGTLVNANTNFLGTVTADTTLLHFTTGPNVGTTFTVDTPITGTSLAFTPTAGSAVLSGHSYILSEPSGGARIRVEAGKVVGYRATGVTEPQSSTDATTGCADNIGPVPPAGPATPQFDFCLVDAFNSHGAPHIERYITQDADNDGCLDNIKLVWNENILDSSYDTVFVPGTEHWKVIFPSGLPGTSITLPYGDAAGGGIRRPAYMVTSDPGTGAPSANDQTTYLVFSDDCGIVRASGTADSGTTATLTDTGSTIGSAQTGDVLQIAPPHAAAGTYSITDVNVGTSTITFSPPAPSAVTSTADYTVMTARSVGNTGMLPVVSFCDGQGDAGRSPACNASTIMTDLRGNRMLAGSNQAVTANTPLTNFIFRHPTVDGAKPVATFAYTQDATRNGYIDRIIVGFSEAVVPTSVDKNTWTAQIRAPTRAGCPLADGTIYTLQSVATVTADPTNGNTPTIGSSNPEAQPTIEFTVVEKSGLNPFGDTGCVPDLTYNGAIFEASTRLAGAAQSMNAIAASGACPVPPSIGGAGPFANNVLCESDGAQPVFQNGKAIASVNTNVAVVTFSEPVFGSGTPVVSGTFAGNTCGLPSQDPVWTSGLLRPADFSYDDESNGGVTGISAVTMVGNDCRKWQLTLNGALTAADVDGAANPDCLRTRKTSTTVSEGIRDGMPAKAMPTAPSSPRIGNPAVPTEDQFSECIEFTQGPPPLSLVETVDSDHNGGIDALRLTFTTSVSDPFGAVLTGDSDIGATVQSPTGFAMCWVNNLPTALPPGPEDAFYAHFGATCSSGTGAVTVGDFRYTALPGVRAAGNAVQGTDADALAGGTAFTATSTILRVPSPGTGTSPHVRDNVYVSANGVIDVPATCPATITTCDFRVSGVDDRFWDVTIGGVTQVVTGVSTGQAARILPDVASHNPATGTAPTGVACHDSDEMLPNQAGDSVLFVCFEEQRDGTGQPLPNTGATNIKVGYTGSSVLRRGADNPGAPVAVFSEIPAIDAAQPVLVEAVVTPMFGTKTLRDLTLTFSEPVVGAGGSKDLAASDFSYVNGNTATTDPDCIEGASSVALTYVPTAPVGTGPVTYRAVRLNAPLSVHDIGGALAGAAACSNPPDSLRAIPGFVKEALGTLQIYDRAVTFTDDTGPQVESAGFVDTDGDGILDAVQVKFNEFINDLTKVDVANRNDWGVRVRTGGTDQAPVYQTMEVLDLTTGQFAGVAAAPATACQNTYSVTAGTGAIPVQLRMLPYNATRTPSELVPITAYGAGANDDHVFLCLNPDKVLANGGTKVAGTGLTGVLTYTGTGASRLSDVFAAPGFTTGSPLADIPSGSPIMIHDMARPVVLNECRRDTFTDHPGDAAFTAGTDVVCPTDTGGRSVETADRNGNGAIDAMRILLSEPINDATVNFNQWSVSNVVGLDFNTGTIADDNEIFLTFTEASDSNSGIGRTTSPALSDVSYFSGGSAADKAAVANLLRGVASGGCVAPATACADERDGAAPTIRQIAAQPGTNLVTVRFSEDVGSGTHGTGAITSAHVAYSNAGGSGASAITGMSHAGDTLTITLNGNLDQADVDNDKLVFTDNSIYEAYCGPDTPPTLTYPNAYPLAGAKPSSCYRELELAVALRTLNNIVGSPPTAPTLTLVTSDADSASFTWTVPTDPDGDLSGYELSYCVCPVFFAGGASTVNVPLSAAPARDVTGLITGSDYTFVVRGVDAAGNRGPDSAPVQVNTEAADTDEPCAIMTLDAGTTTTTSVVLSWSTPKEDCTATLSDGPTSYIVAGATGSITSDAAFDAAILSGTVLSFQPASPTAAGTLQTVTVSNLQSGQTYIFAVKAVDDAGLKSDLGNTVSADITGGTSNADPGAITGLTAVAGGSPATQVTLRFTAPGKDGTTGKVTGYEVRYSDSTITSASPGNLAGSLDVGTLVNPGQSQEITVKGLTPETMYYFTVRAKDNLQLGPVSNVASLKTAAGAGIDLASIQADFARTVKVSHSGGTNTITWGDPPSIPDLGDAIGVQVWKLVDGEWTLLRDIAADDPEFTEKALQDEGTPSDQYKATVYFSDDAAGGHADSPSDISNFDALASASAENKILGLEPWLFWLLLGILVLIIIAVAVLLALRAKRARANDMGDDEDEMGEAGEGMPEGEALPDVPADDLPLAEPAEDVPAAAAASAAGAESAASQPQGTPDKHYLTCPKCATEFSAFGIKPLAIQCPNCGVRGTLR